MAEIDYRKYTKPGQEILIERESSTKEIQGTILEVTSSKIVLSVDDDILMIDLEDIKNFRVFNTAKLNHVKDDENETNEKVKDKEKTNDNVEIEDEKGNKEDKEEQIITKIIDDKEEIESKVEDKDSASSTVNIEHLRIIFSGEPYLRKIEPSFNDELYPEELKSEVLKWKNRFEYAKKVNEPARLTQDITNIAELAESYESKSLYLLAGQLAIFSETNYVKAKDNITKALEIDNYYYIASYTLASIYIHEKKYREAIKYILWTIYIDQKAYNKELIICLGKCLNYIENKKYSSIGSILYWNLKEEEKQLAWDLIALVVYEDPEAFGYAIKGNIEELRGTKVGNDVFDWNIVNGSLESPVKQREKKKKKEVRSNYKGRISVYYQDRGYGFIVEDTTGEIWYFREKDLQGRLLDKVREERKVKDVYFSKSSVPSTGRYPRANNIYLMYEKEDTKDRTSIELQLKAIPKDGSNFAKGMAAARRGELETAEELYEKEISLNGLRIKSAVKELAALKSRKGQTEEALSIIEKYRHIYEENEQNSLSNLAISICIKAKLFREAINILRVLVENPENNKRKIIYQRQEAYCLLALGEFNSAIKILKRIIKDNPYDHTAKQDLIRAENAKEIGNFNIEEEFFESIDTGISVIAKQKLDDCKKTGLDNRAIESGEFTPQDHKRVLDLLENTRGRRPIQRAEFLLTLAWLCQTESITNQNESTNNIKKFEYIGRYFVSMAEATYNEISIDTRRKDVVRCYAIESLMLCPQEFTSSSGARIRVETAWVLLLATYLSEFVDSSKILLPSSEKRLENIIQLFKNENNDWIDFSKDSVFYKEKAPIAYEYLQKVLSNYNIELKSVGDINEKEKSKEIENSFANLPQDNISISRISASRELLTDVLKFHHFKLDKDRLAVFIELLSAIADYHSVRSFTEKEARYFKLERDIKELLQDIKDYPTHISVEYIQPSLLRLNDLVIADFEHRKNAKPELTIENVLEKDFYIVNDDKISLKLLVKSKDEASPPIQTISLLSDDSRSDICHSPEPLLGGHSREIELIIYPTKEQISDVDFSITVKIKYENCKGESEISADFPIAIRLSDVQFEEISNPYSLYAGGKPVEDSNMFFGRSKLISEIIRCITKDFGQCFVLFGQKRSGKSSVLKQIENKLDEKFLYVRISAGEFNANEHTGLFTSFARRFLQQLYFSLEDRDIIPETWPTINDIEKAPMESIINAVRYSKKLNYKIILAVDEFTYIYEKFKDETESFMKSWKSLIESNSFNAVIVGQDTMPRFKSDYPNEFGVTRDERITYLTMNETEELASTPILMPDGSTRYRGQAIKRLFALTAGSPFFLQIFCNKLVEYLNVQHVSFITEADIENVCKILTQGDESLPNDKFDSLITAAGKRSEIFPKDSVFNILKHIAVASLHSGFCYKNSLKSFDNSTEIINDLLVRDIISSTADRVSIRVGLFAVWLRYN